MSGLRRSKRSFTSLISSKCCRSSKFRFRLAAIKSVRLPGTSVLRAAILTWSDRAGVSLMISWNCWWALRASAASSTESVVISRSTSTLARRYGVCVSYSLIRIRQSPSTSTRTVLSGNLSIFNTRAAQPPSQRSSGWGFSTSARRWRTKPSRRSPSTTSSISRMLCAVSTSSGATIAGKITISESPRMGSDSGSVGATTRGGGASSVSEVAVAPRIRINSVSGELMFHATLAIGWLNTRKSSRKFIFLP